MNKITIVATGAIAVVVASPILAQQPPMNLDEGEAILISPKGTVHKSNTKVSATKHQGAVAKGAKEVTRGTVFYRHAGKLYMQVNTTEDNSDWEEGYPR